MEGVEERSYWRMEDVEERESGMFLSWREVLSCFRKR